MHTLGLHKLTQSMGSKGCIFVKCQSLPSYLLTLVPVFLQTECIAEEKRRQNDVEGVLIRRRRGVGEGGEGKEGEKQQTELRTWKETAIICENTSLYTKL